jgi:VWFA-related protein
MHLTEGDEILKNLAEETGGRAFFPYHVDDLNQSFQDIGDELRNQYTITYSPSNFVANGKYHRIKVEIPNHNGYQVRARRGYFARSRTGSANPSQAPAQNPSTSAPPTQTTTEKP